MAPTTRFRWFWWLVAYLALALGVIGIVLPVVPTVPFILLAAFAAARGSQRLHDRLLSHPRLGPMITDWQAHGALRRRAKWLATAMMLIAAALLFWLAPQLWIPLVASSIMTVVCIWLWLRPEPPGDPEPRKETASPPD